MLHSRFAALLLAGALSLGLCFSSGLAQAQHPTLSGSGTAPPPPSGSGQLTVLVSHPSDSSQVEGLSIALYALTPDGQPGLTGSETDASGKAVFDGISTDPGIVYLVGARFREIPFGERAQFIAGQQEVTVEIEIAEPTTRISGIEIDELRARVDWMGDRLVITELLRVVNPSGKVILLSDSEPDRSIVLRRLGEAARDFSAGPTSVGEALELREGNVFFRGPLYPGEQRVEYRYSLPIEGQTGSLRIEMREAIDRLVLVAGTPGLRFEAPGLEEARDVAGDDGAPLTSWTHPGLSAGRELTLGLQVPESRLDPTLLSIPRGDVWLDLDDARLNATVDLQLEVAPGAPVSGTADAPLIHVFLPPGAELTGVAPEAEALGLIPTPDGGFDLIGPVAAGTTSLGYAYHMPTGPEGVDVDMRFGREVATLNVLIADNGLALESGRLHRRRPFRNGTRNYLHREAFNITPEEIVDLSVVPLRGTGLPRTASQALMVAAAAGGLLYLMGPLRRESAQHAVDAPARSPVEEELEARYEAIRDLDHDYETGKLDEADYTLMRNTLRAEAIEILRAERSDGAASTTSPPNPETAAASGAHETAAPATAPTGGFCPACGKRVEPSWKFCSHCGGDLQPDPGAVEV